MKKSENRLMQEDAILDIIRATLTRLIYDPEQWEVYMSHNVQLPKPPAEMIPRDMRCRRYCGWVRAGLEEAWSLMDEYNRQVLKKRDKHFNKAAKLAYGAYKRLSFQDLTDDLKATSLRMYVVAELLEAEYLLRRKCGFESSLPPTTDRPMPH